jgi:hypothetical protein
VTATVIGLGLSFATFWDGIGQAYEFLAVAYLLIFYGSHVRAYRTLSINWIQQPVTVPLRDAS